jgi:D-glycero-D-manno-heptose 1,7-bisphosphate phosphatase
VSAGRVGVYLDRDGTINEEVDFVTRPEQLRLIPGAAQAIRRLNDRDLPVCVVSNQSGIARGFLTEADLVPIHERFRHLLAEGGARVDRICYCPHHPTAGLPPYDRSCECRKPQPGMLLEGARELGLDPARSFVVGDRIVDIQAGKAVGAATVLVLTGYGSRSVGECRDAGVRPDHTAPSLAEAVDYILANLTT